MSRLPRWMHQAYAWAMGYFWLPCPLCGKPFGGHEWRIIDGTIRNPQGGGTGICPNCTRQGLGQHDWYVKADTA